jgi:hypothetical protein
VGISVKEAISIKLSFQTARNNAQPKNHKTSFDLEKYGQTPDQKNDVTGDIIKKAVMNAGAETGNRQRFD